jgi:hypothetical protein
LSASQIRIDAPDAIMQPMIRPIGRIALVKNKTKTKELTTKDRVTKSGRRNFMIF